MNLSKPINFYSPWNNQSWSNKCNTDLYRKKGLHAFLPIYYASGNPIMYFISFKNKTSKSKIFCISQNKCFFFQMKFPGQLCYPVNGHKSRRIVWVCVDDFVGLALNPLSVNPTKWPNTLKLFVGKLPTNCLSVFGHFVKLALKGLKY